MQTIEQTFSSVAQKIGFNVIAEASGTGYQAVSRMVDNPKPGYKYRIRKRILDAVIGLTEKRAENLKRESEALEKNVIGLRQWRDTAFGK